MNAELWHPYGGSPSMLAVLRDDGRTDSATDPFLPIETLVSLHRELLRLRLLDARLVELQRQGRLSSYDSCRGQEATPIAAAFALASGDWVFPALRESGIMLARGFALHKYLAQVFGCETDPSKGRQMPSHASAREVNQVSGSMAVATQLPQAVGAAWAAKIRGDRTISVAFLGDGATSHGDFHGALNFAGVFRAPCVLVCQNNQWASTVPVSRQTAASSLAIKAPAYGVPGVLVDGNDVLAVYRAVSDAAHRARHGGGPTFIECATSRLTPGTTSDDPSRHRTDPMAEWSARDPLVRFTRHLEYLGLTDEKLQVELETDLEREITDAIAVVERLASPRVETLFDDVYGELPWHLREQRAELFEARTWRR